MVFFIFMTSSVKQGSTMSERTESNETDRIHYPLVFHDYSHIVIGFTHRYVFLWVIRVNVLGPGGFSTLVSPSDR